MSFGTFGQILARIKLEILMIQSWSEINTFNLIN